MPGLTGKQESMGYEPEDAHDNGYKHQKHPRIVTGLMRNCTTRALAYERDKL